VHDLDRWLTTVDFAEKDQRIIFGGVRRSHIQAVNEQFDELFAAYPKFFFSARQAYIEIRDDDDSEAGWKQLGRFGPRL
jgi:hypothetical protein